MSTATVTKRRKRRITQPVTEQRPQRVLRANVQKRHARYVAARKLNWQLHLVGAVGLALGIYMTISIFASSLAARADSRTDSLRSETAAIANSTEEVLDRLYELQASSSTDSWVAQLGYVHPNRESIKESIQKQAEAQARLAANTKPGDARAKETSR